MACLSESDIRRLHGGTLTEDERTLLEAHLRECRDCQKRNEGFVASQAEMFQQLKVAGLDATETLREGGELPSRSSPEIEGYEITRELHRGGQGVVYQAIQKSTKRKVAVKVLLEGPYATKSARKRFEREIELVAQLKHPNIIAVFHSGQTKDGHAFCVMDYVRGLPLDHYVREKKLPLEEALKLCATVCEAVNYAHQKGVIHRDLKPSNILVDSEGAPKVLDFGLAKQLLSPEPTLVSVTGQVVGTLPYMSPEQAKGNPDEIDIRTDVYALGVILYQMLTGHYPYPVVGQMADVLKHIAETPPTPPSRSWKSDSGVTKRTTKRIRAGECPIDDEVQTIVLRSLAKERERRYQSAGELARDIGHYLNDEPIAAKRDSAFYVLRKQLRRFRIPVAVSLAFVSLLVAALLISMRMYLREQHARSAEAHQRQVAEAERNSAQIAEATAHTERERAEAEAATAEFRLSAARMQILHARRWIEQLARGARRADEFGYFLSGDIRGDYPATTLDDSERFLVELYPEWIGEVGKSYTQPLPEELRVILATFAEHPRDPRNETLFAWTRAHDDRFNVLKSKSRQYDFDFTSRFSSPQASLMDIEVPRPESIICISRLLLARCVSLHMHGDRDVAAETLACARRIARSVGTNPHIINSLRELSLRRQIYKILNWAVVDTVLAGGDPEPYIRFMTCDTPIPHLAQSFHSEMMLLIQLVSESFCYNPGSGRPEFDFESLDRKLGGDGRRIDAIDYTHVDYKTTLEQLSRIEDEWIKSLHNRRDLVKIPDAADEINGFVRCTPILGMVLPSVSRAIVIQVLSQMDRDASIIVAAICDYKHARGRWPQSIDDALAGSQSQPVARDYFEHDFVYDVSGTTPRLYSVGEDYKDDGGTRHLRSDAFSIEDSGDILYVLTTEQREIALSRARAFAWADRYLNSEKSTGQPEQAYERAVSMLNSLIESGIATPEVWAKLGRVHAYELRDATKAADALLRVRAYPCRGLGLRRGMANPLFSTGYVHAPRPSGIGSNFE